MRMRWGRGGEEGRQGFLGHARLWVILWGSGKSGEDDFCILFKLMSRCKMVKAWPGCSHGGDGKWLDPRQVLKASDN